MNLATYQTISNNSTKIRKTKIKAPQQRLAKNSKKRKMARSNLEMTKEKVQKRMRCKNF